jgi:hypothetical protein
MQFCFIIKLTFSASLKLKCLCKFFILKASNYSNVARVCRGLCAPFLAISARGSLGAHVHVPNCNSRARFLLNVVRPGAPGPRGGILALWFRDEAKRYGERSGTASQVAPYYNTSKFKIYNKFLKIIRTFQKITRGKLQFRWIGWDFTCIPTNAHLHLQWR